MSLTILTVTVETGIPNEPTPLDASGTVRLEFHADACGVHARIHHLHLDLSPG